MHIWQTINALLQGKVSKIDQLFENGANPSLQAVLNEENIITEFKNCNKQLMDYMDINKYQQLVKYIIEMPSEDDNKERAYKYPYVACELLTSEVKQVYEMFLDYSPRSDLNDFSDDDEDEDIRDLRNFVEDGELSYKSNNRLSTKERQKNDELPNFTPIDDLYGEDQNEQVYKIQKFMLTHSPQDIYQMIQDYKYKVSVKERALQEEQNKSSAVRDKLQKLLSRDQKKSDKIKELKQQIEQLEQDNKDLKTQQAQSQQNNEQQQQQIFDPNLAEKKGNYLLQMLFSFLQTDEEVNITLAGYFFKVVNSLLIKREQDVIEFVYSKPIILKKLCEQNKSRSISTILYKLISYGSSDGDEPEYLEDRIRVLDRMSELINDPNTDEEERGNCTFVIGETMSKLQEMRSGNEILEHILNKLSLKWLEGISNGDGQAIYHNCVLLTILVNFLKRQKDAREIDQKYDTKDESTLNYDETNFINNVKENIATLCSKLKIDPSYKIKTQFNKEIQPLGQPKNKIISYISVLINYQEEEFNLELALNNIFEILLDLLETYEWNNILHNIIQEIILKAIDQDNATLLRNLFSKAEFISFLKKVTVEQYSSICPKNNAKAFKKGYLGHVYHIGYMITKKIKGDDQFFEDYIKPHEQDWKEFNSQYFTEQQKRNERDLGDISNSGNDTPSGSQNYDFDEQAVKEKYTDFMSEDSNVSDDKQEPAWDQFDPETKQITEESRGKNSDLEIFDTFEGVRDDSQQQQQGQDKEQEDNEEDENNSSDEQNNENQKQENTNNINEEGIEEMPLGEDQQNNNQDDGNENVQKQTQNYQEEEDINKNSEEQNEELEDKQEQQQNQKETQNEEENQEGEEEENTEEIQKEKNPAKQNDQGSQNSSDQQSTNEEEKSNEEQEELQKKKDSEQKTEEEQKE